MPAQSGHHHGQELLEGFVGIHAQFLGVQNAQLGVCVLYVVHVLQSSFQTAQHRGAVLSDQRIVHDGLCVVQVAEGPEVPLGPGVNDQTPEGSGENSVRLNNNIT
uniref:Uncharacterized protein n=1 Tax=Oncorhynchus kisutch TaxID=8019 RepID=A0A8C7DLR6_ONCKI